MHVKVRDRKYLFIAGGFLVLTIIISVFMGSRVMAYDKALMQQDAEITGLVNELSIQQAAAGQQNNQIVQIATGLDAARKQTDDQMARALIERVTTWSDYDAYQTMRAAIMADYSLPDTSSFTSTFLPSRPMGLSGRAEGYSCRFSEMTSQVTNINANAYSYFSTVKAIVAGPDGGNRTVTVVFLYTTTGGEEIQNLQAYTI